MNEQLQTLLKESYHHFHKKNLKKALNTAQIALEFGRSSGADSNSLLEANLLLSRIYSVNGRYQSEPSFWHKSLQFVQEAQQLNKEIQDQSADIRIALAYGKVCLQLKDYENAVSSFEKCKAIATKLNDLSGQVLAELGLCDIHLNKRELSAATEIANRVLGFMQVNASQAHLKLWAETYLHLSQAYIKNKEYSKSLEMSQQLLQLSRSAGDVEKEVIALRNIAVVCGVKSNYKIGMQYFLEALDKCESIGYRELLVQMQTNIGTIYAHLYNYPEAINRYQMVLQEYSDVLDDNTKVVIFNNLGNIYLTTDHPELAIEHFTNAHSLAKNYHHREMLAHSLAQLCRTKLQLDQFDSALKDAEEAEKLFEEFGEVNGRQINLLNLAEIAFRQNELERSLELTDAAIQSSQKMKDDACEIRGFKHMAKTYKALGDFEQALKFEEKYGEIQDAFTRVQRNRQFLDMEIRHAIREKQKEIEQLTRDNEFKALLLQKSDQISRQNEELLRMNEDLKQFAYVASHDLKEPLRMIGSYTQLIERQLGQHIEEEEKVYFGFINEGVQRMTELLDGLLKYATIGNIDKELDTVNLNDALELSLANLRTRINEADAKIKHDPLPKIKGNQRLLVQLFQNLVGNALKFSKENQKPEIQISGFENENERTIFVKDNGIGISQENQDKIFEIFHRLHARTEYEGTGIGLAICQKIAKQLNGRLWVESEEGKGATFFFALPKG